MNILFYVVLLQRPVTVFYFVYINVDMIKAELRPAGSFIQTSAPTAFSTSTARRHSLTTTRPRRRAKTRSTPIATRQVPGAVPGDEATSQGEPNPRRPGARRPASAWKSRQRRPRFTDNFDAFDDPVLDLDVEDLNLDDLVDSDQTSAPMAATRNSSSSEVSKTGPEVSKTKPEVPKTGSDVIKSGKDLSQTPRAWKDNAAAAAPETSHGDAVTNTSSENWTSSEETTRRESGELVPDFEMSHIRARVLEKYRVATTSVRGVNRPRATHSRPALVSSKSPCRATADGGGTDPHVRRQSPTPQRRLTPIDKRNRNRATKKRRGRRPEATEMSAQYGGQDGVLGSGGGGPRFSVLTSSGRRGRLRPLLSRRSRMSIAEVSGIAPFPQSANPELNPHNEFCKSDSHHADILERGTTFTSSLRVPDVPAECCRPASPFQLHHLPISMTPSLSGSELQLRSPPSTSGDTRPSHLTASVPPHFPTTTLEHL